MSSLFNFSELKKEGVEKEAIWPMDKTCVSHVSTCGDSDLGSARQLASSNSLKTAAYEYYRQGLNIVLVSGKKPLIEWAKWQTQRQTPQDFENLPWDGADGFALIGGSQLANGLFLGCVDFDVKTTSREAQEKGCRALKRIKITQMERTPSGGQHWIYYSHVKPKTIPTYLGKSALELLGENKLIVMAPSRSYSRLNDNTPSTEFNLEHAFRRALRSVGIQVKACRMSHPQRNFNTPNCLKSLSKGEEKKVINFLCKYWKKGYRNRLEMYFLGLCLKKGVNYESARRIISGVADRTKDEEKQARLDLVEYHYRNRLKVPLKAKSGIREILGDFKGEFK